jgi:hypothetical protein
MNEVFVSKTTLINLMGNSAIPFAMFMAGDTIEGKAIKILFENIDQMDLNCSLIKDNMIPLLQSVGVLNADDIIRINDYITKALM